MAVSLPVVLLSILLFFAYGATSGRCDVTPVCDQLAYTLGPTDPRLPSLPSQFSTTVQAVVQSRGPGEISVREYFDDVGNRGRMDFAYNGTSGYLLVDYESLQIFSVVGATECTVRVVEESNPGLRETFGFRLQEGAPHIGTAAHFFRTNDTDSVLFMGQEDLRGIPCNHWQSCYTLSDRSYTIDYYFSRNDSNWTSSYRSDPVPVMIIVNGTNEDESTNSTRSVLNTYTFVDFNVGPDSVPDDVFRVPNGLSCKGRAPGMPLPSLPDYFSAFFEAVDENNKTVSVFRVRLLFLYDTMTIWGVISAKIPKKNHIMQNAL